MDKTEQRILMGNEAIGRGLVEEGCTLAAAYPGTPASEILSAVVAFAKKHNLVVIHDAAYSALVFEGRPLSFLATPGAKEVGIELHSASKSFNMTGWRCGFVAGKKVGSAVKRNRAKRLLREAVRARQDALAPGWDLVFVARARLAEATLSQAQAAVNQLLKRANVVN